MNADVKEIIEKEFATDKPEKLKSYLLLWLVIIFAILFLGIVIGVLPSLRTGYKSVWTMISNCYRDIGNIPHILQRYS